MKLLSSLAKLMNQEVKGQYENSLVAVVIRATSLISILYYLFLAILFFLNGQYMIALYDFVGIMVLSYAAVLTYRNSTRLSYWVHGLSLLLLTIFQCIYVGWEIGFQYCFFVLVVITFFTTYYEFHYKLIIIFGYSLVFAMLYIYTKITPPWIISFNNIDYLLAVITLVYNFGCLTIAGFYFSAKSSGMDKKLMEYNKTLERLAFFDPLTGLYNRRQTVAFLNKRVEVLRTDPTVGNLTVVIGDIDFFKKVNDVYGHACGDLVLKGISHLISSKMEKVGFAARWGGEEFLLVFPAANQEQAARYTQRILEEIREFAVNYNGYPISVTMSFGVQEYEGNTVDELISLADKKLYLAKNSGRNQIVSVASL